MSREAAESDEQTHNKNYTTETSGVSACYLTSKSTIECHVCGFWAIFLLAIWPFFAKNVKNYTLLHFYKKFRNLVFDGLRLIGKAYLFAIFLLFTWMKISQFRFWFVQNTQEDCYFSPFFRKNYTLLHFHKKFQNLVFDGLRLIGKAYLFAIFLLFTWMKISQFRFRSVQNTQ